MAQSENKPSWRYDINHAEEEKTSKTAAADWLPSFRDPTRSFLGPTTRNLSTQSKWRKECLMQEFKIEKKKPVLLLSRFCGY